MNTNDTIQFLQPFKGKPGNRPPFWFMRQAGRYLPEYRELRKKLPDFLTFCYTPDAAVKATLQPIERFDCDAAILFSDILVMADALGQKVSYEEGRGLILEALEDDKAIAALQEDLVEPHLEPVFSAIRIPRHELAADKALIGFAGSPWTVACYMIEGQGSKEFAKTRLFAYRNVEAFQLLIDKLVRGTARYLCKQIESGVDVVQLFDSWAGILPEQEFLSWVIEPTRQIVELVRQRYPNTPIIGFARGAGMYLKAYGSLTGVNGLGVDTAVPMAWATAECSQFVLQGNLDPLLLASDRERTVQATKRLVNQMQGKPYIFNLGHGVIPQTPIEHVQAMCDAVRGG